MGLFDTFSDHLQHAWNAFNSREPTPRSSPFIGYATAYNPSRNYYSRKAEETFVNAIYTRIANDVASIEIQHIKTDDNNRFLKTMDSGLNYCLTVEANKDQTARSFIQDIVESMLDEGEVAVVPIDTDDDITKHASVDILTMRVGQITQHYTDHVQIRVYDDRSGQRREIVMPKRSVAIVENPFYSVMNVPNGTLQRLLHKLSLLDAIDEQSGSGKLDLIIQLPYVIKSDLKKQQADRRRKDIEDQINNSKLGIAYIDGTEHVTQLNRPINNNLMDQIQYLTDTLYSQLGITPEIMNGTADEAAMLNYQNRIIEPILSTICDEFYRKFLTKTARSQHQKIFFYRDPFRLVPVSQIAEIADKFTRNEILSPNEVRQIIGMKPAAAKEADELRNRNINQSEGQQPVYADSEEELKNEPGDLQILKSLVSDKDTI